jgi:hypothetical protein
MFKSKTILPATLLLITGSFQPTAATAQTTQTTLTAAQRVAQFGLSNINGIAYDPGPPLQGCPSTTGGQCNCPPVNEQSPVTSCTSGTTSKLPIDPSLGLSGVALTYFQGQINVYKQDGSVSSRSPLKATFSIFYDSDFANADFASLWSNPTSGGRDDLGRFKKELNINLVHIYDWNSGLQSNSSPVRNHAPFLAYANTLTGSSAACTSGQQPCMRVIIPISNFALTDNTGCKNNDASTCTLATGSCYNQTNWKSFVKNIFNQIYIGENGSIAPAAGMLKIYNEYNTVTACFDFSQDPPKFVQGQAAKPLVNQKVVDVLQYWLSLEDAAKIPDAQRLPIIFPVTYATENGTPGGDVLGVFNAIKSRTGLGVSFWTNRVVYATNPFNPGFFVRSWLTCEDSENPKFPLKKPFGFTCLLDWFSKNAIPSSTPVMFTEFGISYADPNNLAPTCTGQANQTGQACWVKEQFTTLYGTNTCPMGTTTCPYSKGKPTSPQFLGAVAFVKDFRFWLNADQPNFALTDNASGGSWPLPKTTSGSTFFIQTQKYFNPGCTACTTAYYQVNQQKPRPAYCTIQQVFYNNSVPTGISCP